MNKIASVPLNLLVDLQTKGLSAGARIIGFVLGMVALTHGDHTEMQNFMMCMLMASHCFQLVEVKHDSSSRFPPGVKR
jgi:hypothetical protein